MAQKQYVFTEHEREGLLESLELEKLKASQNHFIRDNMTAQKIADVLHRRFHYIVARAFETSP